MQCFWVKASAASPTMTMTKQATTNDDPAFMKLQSTLTNTIRLKVSGQAFDDETVIMFLDSATNTFDGQYDAYKMFTTTPGAPSLYTTVDSCRELSINAMDLTNDHTIYLHMKADVTGTYTITSEILGVFDPGASLIIENVLSGKKTNLLTTNQFSFFVKSAPFDCVPDFIIEYVAPPLPSSIKPNEEIEFNVYPNPSDGLLFFEHGWESGKEVQVQVYNIMGQSVYDELVILSEKATAINMRHLGSGTYVLIVQELGKQHMRKILIEK